MIYSRPEVLEICIEIWHWTKMGYNEAGVFCSMMQYSCQVFLRNNFFERNALDYRITNVTFWKIFLEYILNLVNPTHKTQFFFLSCKPYFPIYFEFTIISVRFGLTILASGFIAKFVSGFCSLWIVFERRILARGSFTAWKISIPSCVDTVILQY